MQGLGTQQDPYLISTPSDLDSIRNDLTAYYELANDIDYDNQEWEEIGDYPTSSFEGSINGNGFTISNIVLNYQNFIAGLRNATLQNIKFNNWEVRGNEIIDAVGYTLLEDLSFNNITFKTHPEDSSGLSVFGSIFNSQINNISIINSEIIDRSNQLTSSFRFIASTIKDNTVFDGFYLANLEISNCTRAAESFGFRIIEKDAVVKNGLIRNCHIKKQEGDGGVHSFGVLSRNLGGYISDEGTTVKNIMVDGINIDYLSGYFGGLIETSRAGNIEEVAVKKVQIGESGISYGSDETNFFGFLVARLRNNNINIRDSYIFDISNYQLSGNRTGSLIGDINPNLEQDSVNIENCYVHKADPLNFGTNGKYTQTGIVIGSREQYTATVNNVYYNSQEDWLDITGNPLPVVGGDQEIADSSGIEGLSDMTVQSNYTGFNFDTIWTMDNQVITNEGYPVLQFEEEFYTLDEYKKITTVKVLTNAGDAKIIAPLMPTTINLLAITGNAIVGVGVPTSIYMYGLDTPVKPTVSADKTVIYTDIKGGRRIYKSDKILPLRALIKHTESRVVILNYVPD